MEYFCWATLMFKEYENDILAGMIKKEYSVTSGIEGGILSQGRKNGPAYIFIIIVKPLNNKKTITAKSISDDFVSVLKTVKAKYYSAMVTVAGDAAYGFSNIILPEEPDAPTKPIVE